MTAAPRPGWYPDPAGAADLYRWWDGDNWTDAVGESARAPRPGAAPLTVDDTAETATTEPDRSTHADADTRRPHSMLRRVVALTCGLAVFLAAGLGVGLVIWREPASSNAPPRSSGGSAPASSLAVPQAPAGQLDESTGVATIGRASMTLPGPPYQLDDDPVQIAGVFDAFFLANAEVHADYAGTHDWSATVGLAHLSPALAHTDNLSQDGAAAMAQLSRRFFGGHPTTVKALSSSERAVDGHSGVLLTGEVHYAIKDLPSRHDTIVAWLVRLDDGSMVAALSSVPNDAGDDVKALARDSIESLTIS